MRWLPLVVAMVMSGCNPVRSEPASSAAPAARTGRTAPDSAAGAPRAEPPPGAPLARAVEAPVVDRFERYLAGFRDLTAAELRSRLKLDQAREVPLGFDPRSARYYRKVVDALHLNADEQRLLTERGVVGVDHAQRYSMGSAYFAIYARDLPVLITTDSILHALHRSYDQVLKELESALLTERIAEVLARVHQELAKQAPAATSPALRASLNDVDLYLTVARNLLRGAGVRDAGSSWGDTWDGKLIVHSKLGQDKKALQLLRLVASLELQDPRRVKTAIYGGARAIDYSQFAPRGHYTDSVRLRRYFRTLMWLGRSDIGWNLTKPGAISAIETDLPRERRAALLLAHLVRRSGALPALARASSVIDFMVGRSDNTGVPEVAAKLEASGVEKLGQLGDDALVERLVSELVAESPGRQQIRSQVIGSHPGDTVETVPPASFQMFGQRFAIDSFVLSQVVFDSIVFRGEKQERMLPRGLDVMAALGNDEAVRLLQPELERHKYAANLLAARRVVEDVSAEAWNENLYNGWLAALRTLDDRPPDGPHLPRAMQGVAWRRKQLQTQLGSWAELRHDTLLYAEQSYTAMAMCAYPAAYVEPYPAFYGAIGRYAARAAELLRGTVITHASWRTEDDLKRLVAAHADYFSLLGEVMQRLERLAQKELRAEPFTADETEFLKRTIDIRGGGSGPPRYDGWYAALIYESLPSSWMPVVADVHTNPRDRQVLEVGVGDVDFLVVAVDNQDDHAIYVGPVFSYYEFTETPEHRLSDRQWHERIAHGKLPARPEWVGAFQAKAESRELDGVPYPRPRSPAPAPVRDPALSKLLDRIAAMQPTYGNGLSLVNAVEEAASRGPFGPRPPDPTSTAPFDSAAAARAGRTAIQRISQRCSEPKGGPAPSAGITFGSDGRAIAVRLYPAGLAATALGRCIEKELRTLRVPPFNRLYFDYPLHFEAHPN